MSELTQIKTVFYTAVISIGTFIAKLLGGWGHDMNTLMLFMILDFGTGLLLATVFKNSTKTHGGALESRACIKGLFRKCMMLTCVIIGHRLDVALGSDYIRTAVIIGFTTNELISIIENMGLMGIKLPQVVMNSIEVLKGKGGEHEKS